MWVLCRVFRARIRKAKHSPSFRKILKRCWTCAWKNMKAPLKTYLVLSAFSKLSFPKNHPHNFCSTSSNASTVKPISRNISRINGRERSRPGWLGTVVVLIITYPHLGRFQAESSKKRSDVVQSYQVILADGYKGE